LPPMALWLWLGFPKSLDISKAIDKKLGVEREKIGERVKLESFQYKGNNVYQTNGDKDKVTLDITVPATDLAKKWDGWGTALKPANEPIVLARKPISEKTIAENVLKWGTGGINIDGCRIEHSEPVKTTNRKQRSASWNMDNCGFDSTNNTTASASPLGRFPANVILDEEAGKLLDEQSGILKSGALKPYQENHQNASSYKMNRYKTFVQPANEGGASRFFYCAKASKKERGEGNNHPTVKPVKLMEYLITLITPPNGIVLDPFFGSGTTGIAAVNLGFNYIGIELDEQYVEIARQRINAVRE